MDAAELRAIQAPIKERYKTDPSAAVITLKARGSIDFGSTAGSTALVARINERCRPHGQFKDYPDAVRRDQDQPDPAARPFLTIIRKF